MAAAVVLKRVVQSGMKSMNNGFATTSSSNISSSLMLKNTSNRLCDYNYNRRNLSQHVNPNGIRVCLVDTLALVCNINAFEAVFRFGIINLLQKSLHN